MYISNLAFLSWDKSLIKLATAQKHKEEALVARLANVLDDDIPVSKFEIQLRYYVFF